MLVASESLWNITQHPCSFLSLSLQPLGEVRVPESPTCPLTMEGNTSHGSLLREMVTVGQCIMRRIPPPSLLSPPHFVSTEVLIHSLEWYHGQLAQFYTLPTKLSGYELGITMMYSQSSVTERLL